MITYTALCQLANDIHSQGNIEGTKWLAVADPADWQSVNNSPLNLLNRTIDKYNLRLEPMFLTHGEKQFIGFVAKDLTAERYEASKRKAIR